LQAPVRINQQPRRGSLDRAFDQDCTAKCLTHACYHLQQAEVGIKSVVECTRTGFAVLTAESVRAACVSTMKLLVVEANSCNNALSQCPLDRDIAQNGLPRVSIPNSVHTAPFKLSCLRHGQASTVSLPRNIPSSSKTGNLHNIVIDATSSLGLYKQSGVLCRNLLDKHSDSDQNRQGNCLHDVPNHSPNANRHDLWCQHGYFGTVQGQI